MQGEQNYWDDALQAYFNLDSTESDSWRCSRVFQMHLHIVCNRDLSTCRSNARQPACVRMSCRICGGSHLNLAVGGFDFHEANGQSEERLPAFVLYLFAPCDHGFQDALAAFSGESKFRACMHGET